MAPIDNIASAVDNKLCTLESIAKMCEEIKTTPKSPYQQEMKTLFSILISQVIEIKQDMLELKQDVVGIKEQLNSLPRSVRMLWFRLRRLSNIRAETQSSSQALKWRTEKQGHS